MKRNLLFASALLFSGLSFAQTIFSENFDSQTAMPAGWVLHNVDGLTPATNVNYVNQAWVIRQNTITGSGNHAVSTSWYNPVGTSNDWLVSPEIAIPATGTYALEFDVMAPDANYPDGHKVYISTTGSEVADFGSPISTVTNSPTSYTTRMIDLSQYAGQTIRFAIVNNNNDRYLLFVDNFIVRKVLENDAKFIASSINRTSLVNNNNTLAINVQNIGSNAITSLDINWNDGTDHSATITTNIAPGATATINHTIPVTSATAQASDLDITITKVNGIDDADPTNNNGEAKIIFVSQQINKKVVVEEGTGTWCQWCPRGKVAMDAMNSYEDFIGIAVHNNDPMAVSAYDNGVDFSGYPSAHVDRQSLDIDVSTADFTTYYNLHKQLIPEGSIAQTITTDGSTITIEATSTFYTNNPNANYRMGVIIIEDGVKGTSSSYNQANVYSGGGYGPMGGFESLPNPVPAAQMVYDHVGRALLGGFNGQASSVPTSVTDQSTHSYTFNYTVPSSQNINHMHAVAVIIDNNTGAIINADKKKINTVVSAEKIETIDMNVFPNPATDKVNVTFEAKGGSYTIDIIDLAGRTLSTQTLSNANGSQTVELNTSDLKAGNYIVTVSTEGTSFTKMIAIK